MTFCDAGALLFSTPRHIAAFAPHSHPITVDFPTPTDWLHRYHWHRHHWHRHHWHHRTSASPVSPRVAIPTFVFTYIIVACRSKSSSPPSSLAIYLFAFADPPPALLSAPSSLAYCPLLVLAAAVTYCICWAHPTLAPTVLTVTALLQLLLKLLLRSWLH